MTQDERWLIRYEEAMKFLNENHRKPSRYVAGKRNLESSELVEGDEEKDECGRTEAGAGRAV